MAAKESLLLAAARAKKGKPEETEAEKLMKEEQAMMADINRKTALKGVKELAKVGASCGAVRKVYPVSGIVAHGVCTSQATQNSTCL